MGFEDREYSQEEWNATPSRETPVTKWFVILTVVLFIMQALTVSAASPVPVLFKYCLLNNSDVLHGQIWRLATFVMCNHPFDILGIVLSLLITWRFGSDLERMYGSHELFMYYAAMALVVGVPFTAFGLIAPDEVMYGSFIVSLGLMALFATHFPRMEVYILPMISIQLRWLVALYALWGLYPSLIALQAGGGLAALVQACRVLTIPFALAYRRYDWHLYALVQHLNPADWRRAWRLRMARQRLRVFQPSDDTANISAKVDAILAKIHEQGSESLTAAERDVLARASEQYKRKM